MNARAASDDERDSSVRVMDVFLIQVKARERPIIYTHIMIRKFGY
jgi:hypothetical protein